jgi:hypothetical protein
LARGLLTPLLAVDEAEQPLAGSGPRKSPPPLHGTSSSAGTQAGRSGTAVSGRPASVLRYTIGWTSENTYLTFQE